MANRLYLSHQNRDKVKTFRDGFTLIEILVALAILGLSLGVIIAGLRTVLRTVDSTASQAKVLSIALSLLESQGSTLPLQYGEVSGIADNDYNWTIVTRPWGSSEDISSRLIGGYIIQVRVTHGDRSVTLSTVRVGPVPHAN